MTTKSRRRARVVYKRDRKGEWRWKVQAANFEIVASGEGYKTLRGAQRGYTAALNAAINAIEIVAP